MKIDTLYHWSPRCRRETILREGLRLFSDPSIQGIPFGYLCFGITPRAAFVLSVETIDAVEMDDDWDLFEVRVSEDDQIRFIMSGCGAEIYEVRAFNSIPADRLFFCGSRDIYAPQHPKNTAQNAQLELNGIEQ